MNQPSVMLEWLYETLIKRTKPPYNIPLAELFLCVPWPHEAEFDYEIPKNNYYLDAPEGKLKVFFLKPHKLLASTGAAAQANENIPGLNLSTPRILWVKKFKYPKISRVQSSKTLRIQPKKLKLLTN